MNDLLTLLETWHQDEAYQRIVDHLEEQLRSGVGGIM